MLQRSCWFLDCVAATVKFNLLWSGYSKCVVKCKKYYSLGDTTTDVYDFSKHPFRKTSGTGMAQQITMENRNINQVAIEMIVGDWVLYDSMRDYDDNYDASWIGRVVSKPEWGG